MTAAMIPPGKGDDHSLCAAYLRDWMAAAGCEVTVSTVPPIIAGPYAHDGFICPHGTTYWLEPTGEQITQWAKDGVR